MRHRSTFPTRPTDGFLTLGDVAALLGVATWRIARVYDTNRRPEPPRFGGRRMFSRDEVRALAALFDVELPGDANEPSEVGR